MGNPRIENLKVDFPLVLDGGLSDELVRMGLNFQSRLWTASALITQPQTIVQAHLNYLRAGARCMTTASYQATIPGFQSLGYSQEEARNLILKSVDLAHEAIEIFHKDSKRTEACYVAASIGPYGAFLADGSEYQGRYEVHDRVMEEFHSERIHLLDNSGADFLAVETIPSYREMEVIAEILKDTQTPAWVSFSCRDVAHISDGTPVTKCVESLKDHPGIFAIGVNCTSPRFISGLLKELKSAMGDKKLIAYPNSGEKYNVKSQSWDGQYHHDINEDKIRDWLNLGVDIIGGCCRVGPDLIRMMAVQVADYKNYVPSDPNDDA